MIQMLKTVAVFVAGTLFAAGAAAQQFPTKPVRIITPYPPGGTTDILSRMMVPHLQQALGQPILVESRSGAGGNVGTDVVVKSPADGYTLLMGASGPLAINVTLFRKLPYNPLKDLAPVIHVASVPLVLVVHPSIGAKNVAELITLLKGKPGGLNFASAGNGTPQHLSAELFKSLAGVDMTHVPYKGTGPAITDLVAGQVPIAFESMIAVLPHVQGGRLRALATTGPKRAAQLPDAPTVAEAGVKGYESIAWYGVMAPAGTPRDVVSLLNREMGRALNTPEVKARLTQLGSDTVHGTPEQFGAFIASEIEKWGKVVRASGATVD